MKESRITSFIGIYGCLIMSNTSSGKISPWFWAALATIWLSRYLYLVLKK
jgi:hypothetical protein